jgi:ribosomal protein S18 acetylase RimI-like enzyme
MQHYLRENQMNREKRIRQLEPSDRSRIKELVVSSGKFNDVEIKTSLELVDNDLKEGEASGYIFAMLECEKKHPALHGYACYGSTPLTQGVYDLYRIVVDTAAQRKGFGQYLLEYVERDVIKHGGRMVLIETSSQETYSATIRFYERNGYQMVARIKNSYRNGDDKLVFSKELT